MKALVFSYGSLILPENLRKFSSRILCSAFVSGYDIDIIKHTEKDYYFLQLRQGISNIPGFLIETKDIESIDRWEGSRYKRIEIVCYTRNMQKQKCFAYFKA